MSAIFFCQNPNLTFNAHSIEMLCFRLKVCDSNQWVAIISLHELQTVGTLLFFPHGIDLLKLIQLMIEKKH